METAKVSSVFLLVVLNQHYFANIAAGEIPASPSQGTEASEMELGRNLPVPAGHTP